MSRFELEGLLDQVGLDREVEGNLLVCTARDELLPKNLRADASVRNHRLSKAVLGVNHNVLFAPHRPPAVGEVAGVLDCREEGVEYLIPRLLRLGLRNDSPSPGCETQLDSASLGQWFCTIPATGSTHSMLPTSDPDGSTSPSTEELASVSTTRPGPRRRREACSRVKAPSCSYVLPARPNCSASGPGRGAVQNLRADASVRITRCSPLRPGRVTAVQSRTVGVNSYTLLLVRMRPIGHQRTGRGRRATYSPLVVRKGSRSRRGAAGAGGRPSPSRRDRERASVQVRLGLRNRETPSDSPRFVHLGCANSRSAIGA